MRLTPYTRIDHSPVKMAPISSAHGGRAGRSDERLRLALVGGRASPLSVRCVSPLNEPEPDLLVLGRRADDYADAHPTPADTWRVGEVASSSLPFDRTVRADLYAVIGVYPTPVRDGRASVRATPKAN